MRAYYCPVDILEAFDLEAYTRDTYNVKIATNGDLMIDYCPNCAKEYHCGVSLTKRLVHCFRCGWVVGIVEFIMEGQILSYRDALRLMTEGGRIADEDDLDKVIAGLDAQLDADLLELSPVVLPSVFKTLEQAMSKGSYAAEKVFDYLNVRGMTESDVDFYGVGIADTDELAGRAVFPIFDPDGSQVYYQGRAVFGKMKPKYKNPSIVEGALGKSDVIFNIENIKDICVVTEGVFSALAFGRMGVAIMGKDLSERQLVLMQTVLPDNVIVCLDSDASDDSVRLAQRIVPYFEKVFYLELPDGKDPDDVGKEGLKGLIQTDLFRCDEDTIMDYEVRKMQRD